MPTTTTPVHLSQRLSWWPVSGRLLQAVSCDQARFFIPLPSGAAAACRYVGVESRLFFQRQHWQPRPMSARLMVGRLVYRFASGALGGAGQGTLDPTYERTHAEHLQSSTSVQAVQAEWRSHPGSLERDGNSRASSLNPRLAARKR